jgi:hypothetical protein
MSPTELTKVRDPLAGTLSVDAVNQLGRDTGQRGGPRDLRPRRRPRRPVDGDGEALRLIVHPPTSQS